MFNLQPVSAVRALRRSVQTLKFRLAAGAMLALAAGIVMSTLLMQRRSEQDTLHAARLDENIEVRRSARLLGIRVHEAQQQLAAAASQLPVESLGNAGALRAFLDSKPILRASFDGVFIVGAQGRMHLLWDDKGYREPGTDLSDRGYFRSAMGDGRPVVTDLIRSRISLEPIIVLAQPVEEAGQRLALLGGSLNLKRRDLASAFTEADGADAGKQLVVIADANGQILAHPDPARIDSRIDAELRLRAASARWPAAARLNGTTGPDLDEPDALISVAAVPGTGWQVWRWRSRADVLAPLAGGRVEALVVSLVLLVAMGVGLLAWLWWQFRPLALLQERARHLFDGSLPVQAHWPSAAGEIGDLALVLRHVAAERAQLETFSSQIIQRLQSVMVAAPVGICFSRNGRFELVSAEMCRLLGRPESALLGQPAQLIYASADEYLALGPRVGAAFAAGQPFDGELAFLRGNGSSFPGRLRGLPVDGSNRDAGTIWTLNDITDDVAARESLEWAATHDPLTGLANRKAFEHRLAQLFGTQPLASPAALLIFDLDRFKPVNDTHGHAAGDAVLRAVAAAMLGCVRSGDLTVRLGGDEFAVLLEHCPADAVRRVAEAIRAAVAGLRVDWQGHSLAVGISVGVAALTEQTATAADWIASADRACYAAKAGGRNQVQVAAELSAPTEHTMPATATA